jgi:hypothetical protein
MVQQFFMCRRTAACAEKDWRSGKRGMQATCAARPSRVRHAVTRAWQATPLSARIRTREYGKITLINEHKKQRTGSYNSRAKQPYCTVLRAARAQPSDENTKYLCQNTIDNTMSYIQRCLSSLHRLVYFRNSGRCCLFSRLYRLCWPFCFCCW